MSNPQLNERGGAVWQPLPKLKSLDPSEIGFQKRDVLSRKTLSFEAWSIGTADSLLGQFASDAEQSHSAPLQQQVSQGLSQNPSDPSLDSADSFQNFDTASLEAIRSEAFQKGVVEGQRIKQEEFEKIQIERDAQALSIEAENTGKFQSQVISILAEISKCTNDLAQSSDQLLDPLKRLSLHLAEQLTLAELSISAASIQTLIERCLEILDLSHPINLSVELNPSDMAVLQNHLAASNDQQVSWKLIANSHLLPGSVRVRADDSVVSDLIENRLESLAQNLLLEPSRWQPQSAFHPERLSARLNSASMVEDALPRSRQDSDNSDTEQFIDARVDGSQENSVNLPDASHD